MTHPDSLRKAIQHVARDSLHDRVLATESVRPIRRATRKDRAAARVNTEHRCPNPLLIEALIPERIVRMPSRRTRRENGKVLRRAIATRWNGQIVFERELAAVALVTDDGVFAAELVAAFEAGAFKDPMIRPVHAVAGFALHELAVAAMVAAEEEAHASQLILRTLYQVMTPQRREQAVVASRINRIQVEPLLPRNESLSFLFAANLPATGVAAEEGHIATFADEFLQMVAHFRRPIFIMPDAEHEFVL